MRLKGDYNLMDPQTYSLEGRLCKALMGVGLAALYLIVSVVAFGIVKTAKKLGERIWRAKWY